MKLTHTLIAIALTTGLVGTAFAEDAVAPAKEPTKVVAVKHVKKVHQAKKAAVKKEAKTDAATATSPQ